MRKLLLATTAGLAASMGAAYAQTAPKVDTTSTAMTSPGAAAATPSQPGTVVIRLNGRVNFYASAVFNGSAGSTYVPATTTTTAAQYKNLSYNFGTYGRLFPGFDGLAANGLKYGAYMDIETNAGTGGSTGTQTFYMKRAFGYLGTDQVGTVRFGYADDPGALLLTGTQESFNDGGWDGDPFFFAGNNTPNWPALQDYGSLYDSSKIVYMSPVFAGLQGGVSFEPSSRSQQTSSYNTGGIASSTGVDSSATGQFARKNTGDFAAQYKNTIGPAGVAIGVDYVVGSSVDTSTAAGINVVSGGVSLTFGGLEVGGWGQYGAYDLESGGALLKPAGQKDGSAYIIGAQYTIGPVVAGVQFFNNWDAGNRTTTTAASGVGTLNEYGVGAGGTYSLVPGVFDLPRLPVGASARKPDGIFDAGTAGTSHNKTFAQLFGFGTQFTW